MELTRTDGEGDPFEGSNVTLSCRTYQYTASSTPPKWSYQINGNGQMQIVDEINPPEGLRFHSIGVIMSCINFKKFNYNIQVFK